MFYFVPIAPAVPAHPGRPVLPLAVSTPKRAAMLPDVPTIVEVGLSDRAVHVLGLGSRCRRDARAPSSTSCTHETAKALQVPAVLRAAWRLGGQPMLMSVDQFGKFVRDDFAAVVKLGKDINLTPTN